jgi:hypothetical protein
MSRRSEQQHDEDGATQRRDERDAKDSTPDQLATP